MTMPEFPTCLIILDIWHSFESTTSIKYVEVMNMLRFSYNNKYQLSYYCN